MHISLYFNNCQFTRAIVYTKTSCQLFLIVFNRKDVYSLKNIALYLICLTYFRSYIGISSQRIFLSVKVESSKSVILDLHELQHNLVKLTLTMWQLGGIGHQNFWLEIRNMAGIIYLSTFISIQQLTSLLIYYFRYNFLDNFPLVTFYYGSSLHVLFEESI